MSTHRIKLAPRAEEDDDAILAEVAFKALGAIAAAFLALTLASLGALIYVLVTGTAASEEPRIEALAGGCKQHAVGDGVWWNSNYPYTLDMRSGCAQLSMSEIRSRRGPWGHGMRVAYVNFGSIHANGVYPMRDEEQFTTKPDGMHCNTSNWHGCVGKGVGVQKAEGMSWGYIVERDLGAVTLGGEAGLFVYYSSWRVLIDSYPVAGKFGPVDMTFEGWQATPFLGATLRYRYLFAQARAYASMKAATHGCSGCSGVTNGTGTQVAAGLSVPF